MRIKFINRNKKLFGIFLFFMLMFFFDKQVIDATDSMSAYSFVNEMNVGWNLGNSLDSKATFSGRGNDANLQQELNWGNPGVSKELIDFVAACGFNTIRIPVTWYYNTYTDSEGNLRIGKAWLARVKEVVDYAITNDMYVILNSHHDQAIFYAGVAEEEMQQVLADASNLWKDIAEYFKDYDEHLIFEAYNEIDNMERSWNYSDVSAVQMNQMNQIFVNTVRATGGNNATRILMVPTLLNGTTTKILNAFVLPQDSVQDRLIVQVHSYSEIFQQGVEKNFIELEKFSERIGAPVIIGEFGTKSTYVMPEFRSIHASNFVARAAAHGIKCIWWDNGSNYAIIDRRDYSNSNVEMIQALIHGSYGIAYQGENELLRNQINQYVLRMPNLKTGAVEEKYWGTLTTDIAGAPIPIQAGENCILSLKAINDATDIWLQRILFYDSFGNYISGKEIQKTDYICAIPAGAAYMRVSMNSPTRTITYEQYGEYMNRADLELSICFVDSNSIVPLQIPQK